MEKGIYEVLEKIEKEGYEAYLVGGFPRDLFLGKRTTDYDICTSATPSTLKNIFSSIVSENFGSLKINYKGIIFEITTFRLENGYVSTRTPIVSFTTSLEDDLQRRDFVINSLCLNKNGEYIDYLGAREDIHQKVIRAIGNPNQKLKEDPLRILRAIRFATTLNFQIESSLSTAILENSDLVSNLSYYRKKEELEKILQSPNCLYGIELLKKYGFDSLLECDFSNIVFVPNLESMWAQLKVSNNYPFTKVEKKKIETIQNLLLQRDIKNIDLYHYGLDLCSYVVQIKGKSGENLLLKYQSLPIHDRKEIKIDIPQIQEITQEPISYVYSLLENQILECGLENDNLALTSFLKEYFK